MLLEFWLERWKRGETGFHQAEVNPYLSYYYGEKGPGLEMRRGLRVFLPLCGKSQDMMWLANNGYDVIGNECSEIAVKGFFTNINLPYTATQSGKYNKYVPEGDHPQKNSLELLQGDFFDLTANDLDKVTDIFDRAALIALPEDIRIKYVAKMVEIQNSGTRTLLVTMTYPQHEMNGPPFSVTELEVYSLYEKSFDIEKLVEKDILANEAKFKERGLSALTETVYKLTRK